MSPSTEVMAVSSPPLIRAPKHRLLDLAVTVQRLGIGLAPAWRLLALKGRGLAGR